MRLSTLARRSYYDLATSGKDDIVFNRKMLKLIQAISKKDQVVAAIKDAILSGAIEPGDQIVESRMAQQLGSGIPLVREALIALEHQGFVQKTPYKGTTVTKLEPKQIREIFQLRVELKRWPLRGRRKMSRQPISK